MFLHRLKDHAQQGSFPVVEACYSWTWNDFHMVPHAHDRAEIMYLLRGKCRIQLFEGERERELTLGVGEFVFIDAGVVHALQVDESCYMVNVEFAFREDPPLLTMEMLSASAALREWLHSARACQCGKDRSGALYAAMSAVVDDFSRAGEGDVALREMHVGQMLIHTAGALADSGSPGKGLVYVRQCARILSERMGEEIRVGDIADELGVSAAYLQRLFRQVHGMTIIDYLNRLRIDRARLLLINTDEPVVDIAMEAGFNNRQHFTRVFTALEGMPPRQYRLEKRGTEARQVFLFP